MCPLGVSLQWGMYPIARGAKGACGGYKHRIPPLLFATQMKRDAGEGGEVKFFRSFQLLEFAAGNGELTMKQAHAAARELAGKPVELTTLDMMAALGACFAAADLSVEGTTLEDVWLLVKDFEAMTVMPNMMTCTHMLGICVNFAAAGRADHKDALAICSWAKDRGVHPDNVMLAQVMDVCAKAAAHARCSLPILKEVLDYARNLDPQVERNVFTYTSMIDAVSKALLTRTAAVNDVTNVWKLMLDDGVLPNCKTYSAAYTAYANVLRKKLDILVPKVIF